MLYVPLNTYEHRSYSATLYPTSFTLDLLLALPICAQRKTRGLGPQVDRATIKTVLSANRVDVGSFSSRSCAFRRTHTSTDPIRLLCIRLALRLTLPLPSGFVPSSRFAVCVSPRALRLVCYFLGVCIFWDERGGGLTPVGPQVDTATIRTTLSTNRVDLGSFSSRCCTFR